MGSEVGPVQALAIVLGLFFALGDLAILVYLTARPAARRLLTRPWSPLDLFLGIQLVLGSVILVAFVALMGITHVYPDATVSLPRLKPVVTFFALFLPVMLLQQVALLLVPIGFVRLKYRTSIKALGLRKTATPAIQLVLMGAALAVLILPLSDLLDTLLRRWLIESGQFPFAEQLRALGRGVSLLDYLDGIRRHVPALILMCLVAGIAGPVAEEVFFRGFAYRILKQRFGAQTAIFTSAALFAAIHVDPVSQVPIFLIGIALAWLYERTGSLAAPIGLHCANNVLTLLFYLLAPHFRFWDGWLRW